MKLFVLYSVNVVLRRIAASRLAVCRSMSSDRKSRPVAFLAQSMEMRSLSNIVLQGRWGSDSSLDRIREVDGMDEQQSLALEKALPALAAFKRAFGRDASPSFVAELLAAKQFELKLHAGYNAPGSDGIDPQGKKYQIKQRSPGTLNVDLNNFSFDFVVLVNVDDNYGVTGIWRMDEAKAKEIFVQRPDFRKYQATQAAFKKTAERVM